MSFSIKSIHPVTGAPQGFIYNGKSLTVLRSKDLKGALAEVLGAYLAEKKKSDTHIQMAYERVYGVESELKEINWEKLTKQMGI